MRVKIILLALLTVSAAYLFWNSVGHYIRLTSLYSSEMQLALTQYWEVMLDKSTYDNPDRITTVATGDYLKDKIKMYRAFPMSVSRTLRSVQVVQVIEYTSKCSLTEDLASYVPGQFRYYHIFLKEDEVWKVIDEYPISPSPDFVSAESPPKHCADFGN